MSIIQTLSKHSFRLALDREVADSLLRKDIAETVKPVELIRTFDSLKATLLNNDHLVGGDSTYSIVRLSTMLTAVLVLALALLFRTLYH